MIRTITRIIRDLCFSYSLMLTGTVREAKEGDSLQLVIKFVPLWNASAHARPTILSYIPVLEENPLGILSFRGYFALQSCFSFHRFNGLQLFQAGGIIVRKSRIVTDCGNCRIEGG